MSLKRTLINRIRGWLPKEPDFNSVNRAIGQRSLINQRLFSMLSIFLACLFILSAFVPLAGYHLESTDIQGVWGIVWNFMLPTGWFSIIVGVCLLFLSMRRNLNNKWLALALFAASISLMVVFFSQDADYFIGLWVGVKGDFDLEGQIAVPFFLGIAGILTSLLLMAIRSKPNANLGYSRKADKLIA